MWWCQNFTTQETLSNATTAKQWLVDALGEKAVADHFVAVSTNLQMINDFGIDPQNVFPMNDWVGGRFSLWSSVGLSIALGVGPNHFGRTSSMVLTPWTHFANTPLHENIPVVLALMTLVVQQFLWIRKRSNYPLHPIPPPAACLLATRHFAESNGKSVDRKGNAVDYQTGNLIWGEPGTNSQHAFFQLIHQGTKLIPAHFIGFKTPARQARSPRQTDGKLFCTNRSPDEREVGKSRSQ